MKTYKDCLTHIEYKWIPEVILDEVNAYVKYGKMPGAFVRAMLENDLRTAVEYPLGYFYLRDLAKYLYNEIPAICHGSKERVEQWSSKGEVHEDL